MDQTVDRDAPANALNCADAYVALRNDFVLEVDGGKPILYPLDFLESSFFVLDPAQAFALSLLSGTRRLAEAQAIFDGVLEPTSPEAFGVLVADADDLVRRHPTQSGIGTAGLLQTATHPITDAVHHDPRRFVLDRAEFDAEMQDIRRRRRLNAPITVMAVPTHRCQTNCIYCYAERRNGRELPLSRWRELVAEMRRLKIHLVSLDNGDVFARRDGVAFLELLLEADMHFLLSTKSRVEAAEVRRLMEAGFGEPVRGVLRRKVQLSVDAVDAPVVRHITRSGAFLENITASFDNFARAGSVPKIKSVMMRCNADQPEKVVDHFYARGAREFQFVKYTRSFFHHSDDLFLDAPALATIADQLARIRDRYPDIRLSDGMGMVDADSPRIPADVRRGFWERRAGCGGGWSMLGISAEGSAFLCEQMTLAPDYCVGDLAVSGIEEVWNGERMRAFIYPERERFAGTVCHDCDAFEPCHWEKGYCYRNALFSYGSIYDAPPLCPRQNKPGLRLS